MYVADPLSRLFLTAGLQMAYADPPIDEANLLLMRAVAKLRSGRAAGICKISMELIKAGGEGACSLG